METVNVVRFGVVANVVRIQQRGKVDGLNFLTRDCIDWTKDKDEPEDEGNVFEGCKHALAHGIKMILAGSGRPPSASYVMLVDCLLGRVCPAARARAATSRQRLRLAPLSDESSRDD